MDVLTELIGILISLSVASERLVEIIKGFIPILNREDLDSTQEGWRRSALQILAVFAGITTAYMSKNILPAELVKTSDDWNTLNILGLGLLASGGSGFWNAILTYVSKVKDIKSIEVKNAK